MSCLTATVRRIGAAVAAVQRVGGLTFRFEREGGNSASVERVGAMTAAVSRVGGLSVRFGLICGTNLDQRPGILWASDGRLITLEGGFLIPNGK